MPDGNDQPIGTVRLLAKVGVKKDKKGSSNLKKQLPTVAAHADKEKAAGKFQAEQRRLQTKKPKTKKSSSSFFSAENMKKVLNVLHPTKED